ncbi:chorion peroxidase-like [Aricia agestis]|uniref:chorion peroxidase-like n=1 Tax=Aricia agestis TaxID=91739 RepID=UPI001C201812|nr:chorion peroxidase-like [Aricia agestis]
MGQPFALCDVADGVESRVDVQFPAAILRQTALLDECPQRGPPKCPPASKRYRTHDGTCNNLNRPRWGSTMTPVQRFIPPVYSDSIQAPRRSIFGSTLPSAREISAAIHENKNVENFGITHLLMQWGQFLDHDVTSSSQSRGFNGSVPRCCIDGGRDFVPKEFMHPECFPIPVPASDPFYGPRGVRCLDFVRSSPAPRDDCALGWREQFNQVSAYIDGSPIYASSARQSDKLRLFRNGMLLYGRVQFRRPASPLDQKDELCRGGAVSTECFKSGDARVNEQPGLVAAHIVWLRMHNRVAQELTNINPHWSDEKTYQETRKIIGAMIQHISYREFLPIILGADVMRLFELELQRKGYYRGYNPKINASPASSFGSAAFRFGHSLVQPSLVRFDRFHRPLKNNVTLHDELTNPSNIWSMGAVDRLMFGMINQPIQKRDEYITEELTNRLFQTPHFDFGMDLAAINIQRGRDHGVPAYTSWREPCGLSAITDFDDLFRVMSARAARKLKNIYRHVDDIDLFTGGMAERPVMGGLVGPTFACIIAQQFSNLRKGDRFWYENGGFDSSFTPAQLQQIRRVSLAQVLCRTLDSIENIQPFVFLSADDNENRRLSCSQGILNDFDLSPWTDIGSDNNVRKASVDDPDLKPSRPRPLKQTTPRPKLTNKKPLVTDYNNKTQKLTDELNFTDFKDDKITTKDTRNKLTDLRDDINATKDTMTKDDKTNQTVHKIDDKLDFQDKALRFNDYDSDRHSPTPRYNDYDDDVQSVQSVIINNLPHKRPYRPYLAVTENIDKYTYLINYVPRPTQSYRQTTRRSYDRDVVKVTYQNYDDTYNRPNRPYYNRGDLDNDFESRHVDSDKTDNTDAFEGRSNDGSEIDHDQTKTFNIDKNNMTEDNTNVNATTESLHKLMTFSYVGTYKGTNTDNSKDDMKTKQETISKDFWTVESKKIDDRTSLDKNNEKLSTFYMYDTVTRPYNHLRPTKRDDITTENHDKYYYEDNILRKYPNKADNKINKEKHENIEERSVPSKIQAELPKRIDSPPRKKKPASQAKTPSVDFQIIPSENSPTHWAVYEEDADIPESLPYLLPAVSDPYALREVPKPMRIRPKSAKRRPGRA